MKFTVLETQGDLSEEAVADMASAVDTFYSAQLADYYNKDGDYFQAINLTPGEQSSITQRAAIAQEPVRNLRQITRGSEIIFDGTIEFLGDAPSSSEIIDVITFLSEENNDVLVSNIVGTGNSELSHVFVVLVEEDSAPTSQTPSLSPSNWSENFLRNPNGIVGPGEGEADEGTDIAWIIIAIVGVATLTMLSFVFANSRRYNRGANNINANSNINTQGRNEMVPVTPASNTADNAESSMVSSVTDWEGGSTLDEKYEVELENVDSGMLRSAAAINCIGTMTLEKEDNSVVPKSWLNALHGDNSSIISPHQEVAAGYGLEASSDDDSSTENVSDGHHGGFPRRNDGAFPTRNVNDWSHIGTVTEDDLSDSKPSAYDIVQTLSQETDASKSSLNQFISDLVWLEKKISDENAKEATRVNPKEGSQGSGIQIADSYSYDCDEFSPRSLSDEESTITSAANSQAMSIVCRDCYIPPGNLDIEIASTKDGPVIKSIGDKSLGGHLNVGDLIMALDDNDTRCLSAEELATTLSSRSSFQRKLTLLHFGGTQL